MINRFHLQKTKLTILLFLIGLSSLIAQEVQLKGEVFDSLQNPLPYTNIIATPLSENQEITFAITDEQGRYKLKLPKATTHHLEITHMGFSKVTDTIILEKNTTRNYTLIESAESLEEVIIKQKMAVVVKDDTITYRTDRFKTGEERKLRDVLKKLPGAEVDREGNVKINGKKVTKLMVDGKTFFTGDTKLGVNNIPADAVDEIDAIDNYNEVSFLKGLNDSDKMALNIKLKKGKKNFLFGDIEAGGGIKERYIIHPTLFYYSPKTAVNVIGDFNNIGKKSFTMQDYINFEGGMSAMIDGSTSYGSILNSDFARFLNQDDFVNQKNDFGAGSISQEITSDLRLEAFTIINKGKTKTRSSNEISYLTEENLDELRENKQENSLTFSLNKLKLRYKPDDENDLAYQTSIKTSNGDVLQNLDSYTTTDTTLTQISQQPKNLSILQELSYSKQFSYEHTSTLSAHYKYSDQSNDNNWLFNQPVFTDLIPFEDDGDFYNLLQQSSSITNEAQLDLKHYWVLNNTNHIYPRVGFSFFNESFTSLDSQLLQDGSINGFDEKGFNNDTKLQLTDSYFGFQYKVKLGDLMVKPGLMYHSYIWNVDQYAEKIAHQQKNFLLPEIKIDYKISSAENLKLDYRLETSFGNAQQYANRLRLVSFNQLYRGNKDLENELYQQISVNYRNFNMYKGIFLFANFTYKKKEKTIRNSTEIEGIDQINTSVYSDLPENSYSVNGSFSKKISKYRFTVRGMMNFSDYSRMINEKLSAYKANNYQYTIKAETRFKDWPNLEIGWKQSVSDFKSERHQSQFTRIDPYAILEWNFLNDFIVKTDYTYNYYKNKSTSQINRFEIGNFSLYYNKEGSPWGYEIDINNAFDVQHKNSNSFDQFMITDRSIYIQPRTILFKLSYKL